MRGRMVISCGGLGMGNASRVLAVAEALLDRDPELKLHVFSWGRGFRFLERSGAGLQLHQLEEFRLGRKYFAWNVAAYLRNCVRLRKALREIDPEQVLLDSDYHFPAFLFSRARLSFIGQADDVVDRARAQRYRACGSSRFLSFHLGERADALVQRFFCDRVFAPSFSSGSAARKGKVRKVPLVVRREFLLPGDREPGGAFVALPGGSGIQRERFVQLAKELGARVVPEEGGLLRAEQLQGARCALVQGGLSSISECVALGVPMLVLPIEGRAEQEINAVTVESLGLGAAWASPLRENGRAPRAQVAANGAELIARELLGS